VCDKPYALSPPLANLTSQLETVDDRHAHVQQSDVRHVRLGARHGVMRAVGDTNIMAEQGQELGERVGHIRNVIDHEDVCHRLEFGSGFPAFLTRVQSCATTPLLTFL
jgi:hypothetical protein